VTHSAYMRSGDIARAGDGSWPISDEEGSGALETLERLCADRDVALPPGVVVDVGRIEGRGWAVVEANAAWAPGICGCDPGGVLQVIGRTTLSADRAATVESRWARTPSLSME